MSNLNRTRTGPHVRFGVQQILDFAEPVKSAYLDVLNASELRLFELESNLPQSLVCTSNMIVAVELMDDQTGQKLLNVIIQRLPGPQNWLLNFLGAFQRKYEILGMSRSPEAKYEN
ncbi:hypothetical protein B0H13DRAFT_1915674 [Mycena leptocephala]|nr:hypothetical protein B0H13DRAFT_1915674 [Mycena leptocephala]